MLEKTGLVLEGGGMRGVYTAGVLEYCLEQGIQFPYVIAVSAGACNAVSYLSGQRGRNRIVTIDYVDHPHYLGVRNWFRERSLFGMRLLFEELPDRLVPFDYEAFGRNPAQLWAVMTDAVTGEAVYMEKENALSSRDMMTYIRASSSLPFVSQPVEASGRVLFDGGVADPIPLRKSIADGNLRHVVVLTKPAGYRKKPFRQGWMARRVYPRYPGLAQAMERRYRVYNESVELAEKMEKEGSVVLIRPTEDLDVGRMTKDKGKLTALYELGMRDAQAAIARLFDKQSD
jgi:predicted patatin/cPLA2 family phospholipase